MNEDSHSRKDVRLVGDIGRIKYVVNTLTLDVKLFLKSSL